MDQSDPDIKQLIENLAYRTWQVFPDAHRAWISVEDLIQNGWVFYLIGRTRWPYNQSRGAAFKTYMTMHLRAEFFNLVERLRTKKRHTPLPPEEYDDTSEPTNSHHFDFIEQSIDFDHLEVSFSDDTRKVFQFLWRCAQKGERISFTRAAGHLGFKNGRMCEAVAELRSCEELRHLLGGDHA